MRRVRAAEVKPEEFHHTAHLKFAFLCLKESGLERAQDKVCEGISRLAHLWEVGEMFHRTITRALVVLVHQRTEEETSWEQARTKLADLQQNALAVLGTHYSRELLWSEKARLRFVAPDLVDFDGNSTVGQLRRITGLSRSALLHYEKKGLLQASAHTPAGYRLYDEEARDKLRTVLRYRRAGMSLERIIELYRRPASETDDLLKLRLRQIDAELEALQKQQDTLFDMLGTGRPPANLDPAGWSQLLREAGLSENGLTRWHRLFEERAPEAHREFLMRLGLTVEKVEGVRAWSRGESPEPV